VIDLKSRMWGIKALHSDVTVRKVFLT
jgi:hypothetical protein